MLLHMEWLMLATGFTGALSLVFVLRLLHQTLADTPSVSAHFSPKGGCTDAVVAQLGKAKKDVLVLARSFASDPLVKALQDAKMRGVRVEIILDRQNEKDPTSSLHVLAEQGLVPALDSHFTCCHDNLMLIDGRVLLTGSFDFTRQGEEENSDTLLIVTGHRDALNAALEHFRKAKPHAKEFGRPAVSKPDGLPKIEMPPLNPASKAA